MYGKIVGIGPIIKGESKKSGKPYHGQSVHLMYHKPGIDGTVVKEQFISFLDEKTPPTFKVNDEIFLDYDDKGMLLSAEVVTQRK